MRHRVEKTLLLLGALACFDPIPVCKYFACTASSSLIAEHMRVTPDDLGGDCGNHVIDREFAIICSDLGVKNHLQQNVAEFLSELSDVVDLYGVTAS